MRQFNFYQDFFFRLTPKTWERYKNQKNKVKKPVDESNKQFYQFYLWKKSIIFEVKKQLQNNEKKKQLCVNDLNSKSLNTYFVNVGKNLSPVLPDHVKAKSKYKCSSSLCLRQTRSLEIDRCIIGIKNSRFEEFMGISNTFLKLVDSEISCVLFFLINRAIWNQNPIFLKSS